MSTPKKKPDWSICVKQGEQWQTVGAAWQTERGNISARLERPLPAGNLMLFPYRERKGWRGGGDGEHGAYPKGHPGNVRPGESMQGYFDRRRAGGEVQDRAWEQEHGPEASP